MSLLTQIVLWIAISAPAEDASALDVEQWARTFRIQVYEAFRADRTEFDHRRQEAERVLAEWRAAGQRPEDRALLVEWLQHAVHASQLGSISPLPAAPRFSLKTESAQSDEPAHARLIIEPPQSQNPPSPELPDRTPRIETPGPEPEQPIRIIPAPTDKPPAAGKQHTQISLVELSARLTGYNRGVRAVEIKLSERRPCTVAELSSVLDDLAELARRGRDLSLYREHLITESERENLPTPTALNDAMGLLGDRIFATRQTLQSGDSSGADVDRQSELNQLEVLSQRLAEIAAPRPPVQTRPAAATP